MYQINASPNAWPHHNPTSEFSSAWSPGVRDQRLRAQSQEAAPSPPGHSGKSQVDAYASYGSMNSGGFPPPPPKAEGVLEQVTERDRSFTYSCWFVLRDATQERQGQSCPGQGGWGCRGAFMPPLGASPSQCLHGRCWLANQDALETHSGVCEGFVTR